MNRSRDFWSQAQADLRHARHALEDGDYEWAAFAAQQAAEKGLKAAILAFGGEPWGHSLLRLCYVLSEKRPVPEGVTRSARRLDRHYIPARYPNGWDAGAPHEYYDAEAAQEAIADAEAVLAFCQDLVLR